MNLLISFRYHRYHRNKAESHLMWSRIDTGMNMSSVLSPCLTKSSDRQWQLWAKMAPTSQHFWPCACIYETLQVTCTVFSQIWCVICCDVLWSVVTLLLCGKCSVAGNIAAWQVITVITCHGWASVGFLESLGEKPGCISLYLGQRLGRATTPWWVVVQHITYTIPGCT